MVWYGVVWCDVVWCGVGWRGVVGEAWSGGMVWWVWSGGVSCSNTNSANENITS